MTERVSVLFHTIEKNICVGEKQHQVHHNSWDVIVSFKNDMFPSELIAYRAFT
jgi:hypothetical protein